MSDEGSSSPRPPPHRRRSSIVELFSTRPTNGSNSMSTSPPASAAVPASPGVPQHRRGLSITNMGLAGSSGQTSPYNAFAKQRRASVATSTGSSSPEFRNSFGDENAVIEDDEQPKYQSTPSGGPFARRVSVGAQALRDARQGSGPGSPAAGEGFNWSDALRDRTKRSPSFSSSANPFAANAPANPNLNRSRPSNPVATPEPPKEMPKAVEPPTVSVRKPDHLGERMLRGDFMMD